MRRQPDQEQIQRLSAKTLDQVFVTRETAHSPEAVDHYLLDFARVYFATIKRGMTSQETAFTIQRPGYLVDEYVTLIKELKLTPEQVENRAGVPENSLQNKQVEDD